MLLPPQLIRVPQTTSKAIQTISFEVTSLSIAMFSDGVR